MPKSEPGAASPAAGLQPAPGVAAADEPALGARQRVLVVGALRQRGRALVEGHDDVGAERLLDLDGALRGEEVARAVEVGAEGDALLGDLDEPGPARSRPAARSPRLKTWKPPESVSIAPGPGHEAVQPAQPARPARARGGGTGGRCCARMIRAPSASRSRGSSVFTRGRGAHRHEDRRLDARRAGWRGGRGGRRRPSRGARSGSRPRVSPAPGARVKARGRVRRGARRSAATFSTSARQARPPRPSATMRSPTLRSTGAAGLVPADDGAGRRARRGRARAAPRPRRRRAGAGPGQRIEQPPSETLRVVTSRPRRRRARRRAARSWA